jgi:hypothetical protein
MMSGIVLPGGGRLYLESVRVAGRNLTTEAAVHRFLAAQQPDAQAADAPPATAARPAARRRKRETARADAACTQLLGG